MRGHSSKQLPMYFVINVEGERPSSHPLRAIKRRADAILASMNRDFEAAYSKIGRPGIAPEGLLKALLLQALYSIRSEIQLGRGMQTSLMAVGAVVDNALYAQRHVPARESGQSRLIVKLRAMSRAPWKNKSLGPRRGREWTFASRASTGREKGLRIRL